MTTGVPPRLLEIAERRARNTGESFEEALKHVVDVDAMMSADAEADDQSWVAAWIADVEWVPNAEASSWIRSRPSDIQELMIKFPPSCVVTSLASLRIPAPGTAGIVVGYSSPDTLSVIQSPTSRFRAYCNASDLEVLGYWQGWTPERVRAVLSDG